METVVQTPSDRNFYLGQASDIPVVGDWNGDGLTKVGVFRDGLWILDYNGNGQWDGPDIDRAFGLGQPGDRPVVGDWNGDHRTKAGVFRNGFWLLDYNGNCAWDVNDRVFGFGMAGDTPVVGDWNGSGFGKIGIYRPGWFFYILDFFILDYDGNGVWQEPNDRTIWLGPGIPIAGDWNGDGAVEVGTYQNGMWRFRYPGAVDALLGMAGDIP